jgi:putative hydrolase of the HAD superfamily
MDKELKPGTITTLFLDIGGVLLTNGWGQTSRKKAAAKFGLDSKEIEERHHLTFDTYEEGKLTLDEYLGRVIFNEHREFSKDEFKTFMFAESQPLGNNLTYFINLKKKYGLKVFAVSNEGRELNEHRIREFKMNELFDAYISSCYIHLRKPDMDVWRMAGDISQSSPEHCLYIDDRMMFIEVAQTMGLQTLHYIDMDTTKQFIETRTFYNADETQ